MKLLNKVALITGAGSGIGREAAVLFAKEGATIVAVDINSKGLTATESLLEKCNGGLHQTSSEVPI